MSKLLMKIFALGILCQAASLAAEGPSLEPLQGKWQAKRTGEDGQMVTQIVEIQKGAFSFQSIGADGQIRFNAKGAIKSAQYGPFKVLEISDIQRIRSSGETQAVNDELAVIYALDDGTLTLASNFDRARDRQKAEAITYTRMASAAPAADALAGKWKMELTAGDDTRDYELRLSKVDGKLDAVVVSPRSGEHKARLVTFKDGDLNIEVDREIQGNNATFVYTGKLKDGELSGKFSIKGAEDQYSGTWKAKK